MDTLTGENRVLRTDILHDCGDSLNPAIDLGQIEGGYVQGVGWLTSEELWWDGKGALAPTPRRPTRSRPAPTWRRIFACETAENLANREKTIYRSKAVGEPPLMLALSAFLAIRDAIADSATASPALEAPATPESILNALRDVPGE